MSKWTPINWLKQRYRRRWMKWLDKRIPANDTIFMTLDTIFILPTGFGWSFIVMAFCLFLLGTNYQNNLMLLLCYLMLAIMLLALFYSHQNFARLALKAQRIRGFHCHQQGELPLQIIPHNQHPGKHCQGTLHLSWLLPPNDTASSFRNTLHEHTLYQAGNEALAKIDTLQVPIGISRRGKHFLPRLTIACDFPLGLYKCWTHLDIDKWVMVYPKPIEGQVNVVKQDEEGEQTSLAPSKAGTADFYALTDYEVGQPLNRVAWKQVAKNGNWVVKQFTDAVSDKHIITVPQSFNTEEAVSILTHQVIALHQQQKTYGLKYRDIDIAPGLGQSHLSLCLDALAVVDNPSIQASSTPFVSTRDNQERNTIADLVRKKR